VGIGVVNPIYYFLHYAMSPIEKFKATDMRLTRRNYSLAILPSLILVYYLPLISMFQLPTLAGREKSLFFWQLSPVWISLTSLIFTYFIPNTMQEDRIKAPKRDVGIMRYTIGALAIYSATVWIRSVWLGPFSLYSLFIPDHAPVYSSEMVPFCREFLQVDELSLMGSSLLWLAYLFGDMKYAGMLSTSWVQIVFYAIVSTAIAGPGATIGLGWLWREDIITNRRHKDAITAESIARSATEKTKSRKEQ
jgi:hypothetical protein